MGNRLYVGNLSFTMTEDELRREFEKCGSVTDAKIVMDRETGRARGFGFVQYATEGEAAAAIQAFNGAQVGGRALTVNVAVDRPRTGGGGGARNFGGGNGGGAPRASNGGGYNSGGGYSSGPPSGDSGGGGGKGRGGKGSRRRREDNDWG